MAEVQGSNPQPAAGPGREASSRRGGRSGRGRGGRGRGSAHGPRRQHTETTGNGQVTQNAPAQSANSDLTGPSHQRGGRQGGRGPRRGRRGTSSSNSRTTFGTQRAFGGTLTTQDEANSEAATGLSGDAPAFVPGQAVTQRSTTAHATEQSSRKAVRRGSKSMAPDLPTRIQDDIDNGQYECVICTSEVLRNSRIWSCSVCWTAVHLPCVKKWYSNQTKNADQQQHNWRCPGCNSFLTEEPVTYTCWCGKDINPRPIMGLPPHSCGQTCSKPRGTCPHPCPLQCHAGPCPPCALMGPSQSCFCGKNTSTKRCGETDYTQGWSCQETCGDLLPCGEHECNRPCHSGLCGSCELPIPSRCYCGRVHKEIPCDERGDQYDSFNYGQISDSSSSDEDGISTGDSFIGCFECDSACERKFDCGEHTCQKTCHPQDQTSAHCPFSPDVVINCPCGKTPLMDILDAPRASCRDEIPNCKEICGKVLSCGHSCGQFCHAGPCGSCSQKVEIPCRCGRTISDSVCHQGEIFHPVCMRVCRAQLNCGRHECGERCCPGEKKASERVATRRKNKTPSTSNEEVEAEHICIRPCGRTLRCGKHQCQQMCHRGPCPSCLEAIFEEISCACGRTILQPPQPCGTGPPVCRYDCTRPRPCGHPQTSHQCHPDSEPCSKCPFLVERLCICGKQKLKNQPCWFNDARCGLPCGKKLKCGTHTCKKLCHKPGECEDSGIAGSHCTQPCGKTRKSCDHECMDQCHAPFACKEDKPCQAKTFVTCDCQHRKQEVKCMASKTNPQPSRMTLKCDDECLRLQRNQRLAQALNIDPETHTDDHVPYSDTTLKLFRDNFKWAQTQEREFRVFAGEHNEKRIRFKPMPSHQRSFLHSLAEDFGLDSESQDPEPHRHVCIFKTPRFVSAPKKTLAQCVQIKATSTATQPALRPNVAVEENHRFNALLLSSPRFALTIDEVDGALATDFSAYPNLYFKTSFLPSEEIVIAASGGWNAAAVEASITNLKPMVSRTISSLALAKSVSLCHVDSSLNVLRREGGPGTSSSGGWNAVVSRSTLKQTRQSAGAPAEQKPVGRTFLALKKETKKKTEPVEDDWEAAAEKLDEC